MEDMNKIWTYELVSRFRFGSIEIGIERNHVLFLQNPKKYKYIKDNKVFYVYKMDIYNGDFFFEKVFIKKRHAKKAYNKIKDFL